MSDDDMLDSMGEMAKPVAALTGMKKQFTDSGWSESAAEEMVLAIYEKS